MARKLQIKRGLKATMPELAQGELAMTTDVGSEGLYVGIGDGTNIEIANKEHAHGAILETNANLEQKFWRGTKEEYDAISVKDPNTMYIVVDDDGVVVSGGGDMEASVYDPQGKATDIFAYVDEQIQAAIGSAIAASY